MQDSVSDAQEQSTRPEISPDLSITELGLKTRAQNILLNADITTIGDALAALEKGDKALTDMRGFGPKSLAHLKERLRERSFILPGEVAPPLEEAAPVVVEAVPEEAEIVREPPSFGQRLKATFASVRERLSATLGPFFERLGATLAPARERLGATLAPARERLSAGARAYGVYILIGVLVIIALFLPPASLLERLGIVGYTTVNAENNSIKHENLTLTVGPAFSGKLRVRLESIPRADFLGFAHSSYRDAVEALPSHLEVKSELYKINTKGKPGQPVMIDVAMPAAAEPWETLDLYTWTGETWEWVGSEVHTEIVEREFIRAQVTDVPANLVVVQAGAATPTVAAYIGPGDDPATAAGVLDEVNPIGLRLGTDGSIIGNPASLPQPSEGTPCAVLPALRNWAPGESIIQGPLSDLLAVPEIQEAHISKIVQLCTERAFAGVDVDYRGVTPDKQDAYSAFISALSRALHAEGLRLTVVVEPPAPTDGSWDTNGYDWAALGAAADAVKVPFPADPAAYVEMGEAQRLLDWAKAQMPRYKLYMLVSSLSVERGSEDANISLEQALAPFGEVMALNGASEVEPGSQVEFGLSGTGTIRGIVPDEAAGTYRIAYQNDSGETRTIWLGTASSLAAKLEWAQHYHLGGVAVAGMLATGNAPGIVDAVASYCTAAAPPAERDVNVVWTVASAEAMVDQQTSPLTDPGYTWMVLATSGAYTVNAAIAGFDHGSAAIVVSEPEPPAEEPPAAEEPVVAGAEEPSDEGTTSEGSGDATGACLRARFERETVPDNTQIEAGEEFVKAWSLKSAGTCDWPEDTALVKVNSQLGGPESVPIGMVAVGETVEISVTLVAPDTDGTYNGHWALRTGNTNIPGAEDLWVLIRVGEGGGSGEAPAPAPAPAPPPPAPITGGAFELGGHVEDLSFPHGDLMHYAGMNWAKAQVRWRGDPSGIIASAHAHGFKIQLSALGPANMVTQASFEQDVAGWVAGMAAAGADAIEVWNEPNIDREWQNGYISPQAYTNLLCTAYHAIKAANPGTLVIGAAPAPTGYFGGCGPGGCDDQPWMEGLYNAGAANCMDYIGAHHNAGATSPSARSGHVAGTHHSWYFLPQTELYYNIFRGTRKLFYTEMGYVSPEGYGWIPDSFSWGGNTTVAQQAAWLAEAAQLSASTGMVRCIIVWNVDYKCYGMCGGVPDPQAGYAIIRPDGTCPACDALHNVLGTR